VCAVSSLFFQITLLLIPCGYVILDDLRKIRLSWFDRVSPEQECTCFFQPRCRNESFCMETLAPATVQAAVDELLELS
jgi:hypothetical protein